MNNFSPLFSILVANYNNAKFFDDLFPSLINQTYGNIEIIFVDDGSTDNSLNKAQKYAARDSRIKIFDNQQNMGCAFTKKRCIDLSSGVFFGFVDPDDFIESNAVEIMINQLINDSEISLVHSNFYICDEKLSNRKQFTQPSDIDEGKLLMFGFAPNHFSAFSRQKYNQTQGIDTSFKRAIDRDLVLKMEEVGRVVHIPKYLYNYRINSNCISNNQNSYKAQYWAWQARFSACERRGLRKEDVYSEIMSYIDGKRFDFSTTTDYKLGKKILSIPRWIKYKLFKRK
ncbi:MAG: glycosyltransferase [Bacteroidales bacterium]|nr:glycosyltransferase [Bacteroidales bacterium]